MANAYGFMDSLSKVPAGISASQSIVCFHHVLMAIAQKMSDSLAIGMSGLEPIQNISSPPRTISENRTAQSIASLNTTS